jgi:hypothetical protein
LTSWPTDWRASGQTGAIPSGSSWPERSLPPSSLSTPGNSGLQTQGRVGGVPGRRCAAETLPSHLLLDQSLSDYVGWRRWREPRRKRSQSSIGYSRLLYGGHDLGAPASSTRGRDRWSRSGQATSGAKRHVLITLLDTDLDNS